MAFEEVLWRRVGPSVRPDQLPRSERVPSAAGRTQERPLSRRCPDGCTDSHIRRSAHV